jgi:hypothetical protein
VKDIDEIVRYVRFAGWQNTHAGEREVKKALRKTLFKYKLHQDQELFESRLWVHPAVLLINRRRRLRRSDPVVDLSISSSACDARRRGANNVCSCHGHLPPSTERAEWPSQLSFQATAARKRPSSSRAWLSETFAASSSSSDQA